MMLYKAHGVTDPTVSNRPSELTECDKLLDPRTMTEVNRTPISFQGGLKSGSTS